MLICLLYRGGGGPLFFLFTHNNGRAINGNLRWNAYLYKNKIFQQRLRNVVTWNLSIGVSMQPIFFESGKNTVSSCSKPCNIESTYHWLFIVLLLAYLYLPNQPTIQQTIKKNAVTLRWPIASWCFAYKEALGFCNVTQVEDIAFWILEFQVKQLPVCLVRNTYVWV